MRLLLALALSAAHGYLQPPALRLRASEQSEAQALVDACKLPGAQLELRTSSNMLATDTLDALRRCHKPLVQLRAPLLPVHRERLAKVAAAEPLFELSQDAALDWTAVSALGPRHVAVRLGGELTEARAAMLSRFRDATVELDLRGRVPEAAELARFRGLSRAERVVRIGAGSPPEMVSLLAQLKPAELVVEAGNNRLPPALLQALADADLPTRVALSWPFVPRDLEPLTALRRLALEVDLGTVERLPRGLPQALAPVEPDASKPRSSAAPGPELPAGRP